MPYGVVSDVAAMARVWTNDGAFVDPDPEADPPVRGTNPSAASVADWLINVSAQMDTALRSEWFEAPLDAELSPTAYNAIKHYVVTLVADIVHTSNNADRSTSSAGVTLKDMVAWVKLNADGILRDGIHQDDESNLKTQVTFRVISPI